MPITTLVALFSLRKLSNVYHWWRSIGGLAKAQQIGFVSLDRAGHMPSCTCLVVPNLYLVLYPGMWGCGGCHI